MPKLLFYRLTFEPHGACCVITAWSRISLLETITLIYSWFLGLYTGTSYLNGNKTLKSWLFPSRSLLFNTLYNFESRSTYEIILLSGLIFLQPFFKIQTNHANILLAISKELKYDLYWFPNSKWSYKKLSTPEYWDIWICFPSYLTLNKVAWKNRSFQ
jgi:hypothetical protein